MEVPLLKDALPAADKNKRECEAPKRLFSFLTIPYVRATIWTKEYNMKKLFSVLMAAILLVLPVSLSACASTEMINNFD